MAPRKTVKDIHEAVEKTINFAPQDVTLRDKSKVHVGRFHFVHFQPLWNAVQVIAGEILSARNDHGTDLAALLSGSLAEMPELALKLAAYSTQPKLLNSSDPSEPQLLSDYISTMQTEWDYLDIFRVAKVAINVNFGNGEGGEIMDFLSAATDAFSGRKEAATPRHPTQPAKRASIQALNLLVPAPVTDGATA